MTPLSILETWNMEQLATEPTRAAPPRMYSIFRVQEMSRSLYIPMKLGYGVFSS